MHLLGYHGSNWPRATLGFHVMSLTHIPVAHILPFRVTKTTRCVVSV